MKLTMEDVTFFTLKKSSKPSLLLFKLLKFFQLLDSNSSAKVEAAILIILAILMLPTNILAIYRFYKKKLNKIFFILVTSLCVCNLIFFIPSIINGLSKITQSHPLGLYGCFISTIGGCGITTTIMMIQVLISYERVKVITSVSIYTFQKRVYIFLSLVFLYGFGFWTFYFIFYGGLTYLPVRIDANSTQTVGVCCTTQLGFFGTPEIVYTFVAFLIPTALILFNYK